MPQLSFIGQSTKALDTPALLVDLEVLDSSVG